MPKLFTIFDPRVHSDTVTFLSETDGTASSYFYNYSVVLKRADFVLICIAEIAYSSESGLNEFVNIDRIEICRMPEEYDDEVKK